MWGKEVINGTKVICLCGSTRFSEEMLMLTWEFAKKGIIALGWCILPVHIRVSRPEVKDHLAEAEGVAGILDELHLRKIDLADEVFVVNVGGYIGEGTKREIAYAQHTNKPVVYMQDHSWYSWKNMR
jgi:hypothetical protein